MKYITITIVFFLIGTLIWQDSAKQRNVPQQNNDPLPVTMKADSIPVNRKKRISIFDGTRLGTVAMFNGPRVQTGVHRFWPDTTTTMFYIDCYLEEKKYELFQCLKFNDTTTIKPSAADTLFRYSGVIRAAGKIFIELKTGPDGQ